MHSFIKNNKQFFSLLVGISLSSSLHAITYNSQPLDIPRGQDFCSGLIKKDTFLILELENGNFNLTLYGINKLGNLKEVFRQFSDDSFGPMSSRMCNSLSNNYNSLYLVDRDKMDIQARSSLKFTHCLFESPFIYVIGNTITFDDCFLINTKVLKIIGDYPESDYKVIQIIFHDQPENPTIITAEIDLKNNKTKQTLIILNVKKITIEFNPRVWDN